MIIIKKKEFFAMKKLFKCLTVILVLSALILSMTGCSLLDRIREASIKDKDFSKAGLTITLTDEFSEKDIVTHTAYYVSQKAVVLTLKEDGSQSNIKTPKMYAELICQVNKITNVEITEKDGYAEFNYENETGGKEYYYYARCYKNGTDFWLVQFGCETKNTEELTPLFEKWANSVKFN